MARTLPWLKGQRTEAQEIRDNPSTKRRRVDPDRPSYSSRTPKRGRTPSTSPPPQPPPEELMHEGLTLDDHYIMVEDEFLSTAQSFTQHLHHAEYLRLKALAQSKSLSKIQTISRPVDTVTAMPSELKKRKEGEAKTSQQKEALRAILDEDETTEDDRNEDPWVGTRLQGLMMTSPSRTQRNLASVAGVKGSTRAAAGFDIGTKAVVACVSRPIVTRELPPDGFTDSDENGNDLDRPVHAKTEVKVRRKTAAAETQTVSRRTPQETSPPKKSHLWPCPPGKVDDNALKARPKATYAGDSSKDSFDLLLKPRSLPKEASHFLQKRKARLKAEMIKPGDKKPIVLDEIPTFLV